MNVFNTLISTVVMFATKNLSIQLTSFQVIYFHLFFFSDYNFIEIFSAIGYNYQFPSLNFDIQHRMDILHLLVI